MRAITDARVTSSDAAVLADLQNIRARSRYTADYLFIVRLIIPQAQIIFLTNSHFAVSY